MPVITYLDADGGMVILDVEHFSDAEQAALVAGAHPTARVDLDRQLTGVRVRERRLMASATAEQQLIGWGGFVTYVTGPPAPVAMRGIRIYGQLYTRGQIRKREAAAIAGLRAGRTGRDLVDSARSLNESMAHAESAHAAGWRHGRWYSKNELGGELGEVHIAELEVISGPQFYAARRDLWPQDVPAA